MTASAKVQHRPKPRYGTPPGEVRALSAREFNSTGDIRDAIYEDWYKERIKAAKIKKKEEEKKKKEKEEKEQKVTSLLILDFFFNTFCPTIFMYCM